MTAASNRRACDLRVRHAVKAEREAIKRIIKQFEDNIIRHLPVSSNPETAMGLILTMLNDEIARRP
jgi:hypothetical protein